MHSRRLRDFGLTVLLGALAALPPLSIDLGLPALPDIGRAFDVAPEVAGETLSVFLVGFAFAQLLFGLLSDRIGRRPVLIVGCALYAAAGAAAALAPSFGALLAARVGQGVGAGAGTALAFAIVRDLFEGDAARTRLSLVAIVVSVAPLIAPSLGAIVLAVAGWRGVYGVLAAAGAALTGAIVAGFGETRSGVASQLDLSGSRKWLQSRSVLAPALTNAISFGALFAYVSGSPGLFLSVYKLSPTQYGGVFACTAGGILLGAALNAALARRLRAETTLSLAAIGAAATAVILLALFARTALPPMAVVLPLLVANTFCFGLISPNATHLALDVSPTRSGAVSAWLGFLRMGVGAVASAAVSGLSSRLGVLTTPAAMAAFSLLSLVVWTSLRARGAKPQRAPIKAPPSPR